MIRVRKNLARKAYEAGYEVFLLPCKIELGNPYISPIAFTYDEQGWDSFDLLVANYTWYNCNKEVGLYPHFYISELEKFVLED